jgi:ABC-type proline/glycine betaine transport system permease subunit
VLAEPLDDFVADSSGATVATAKVLELSGEHVILAVLPLLIGLAVPVPLGWVAQRMRWLRAVALGSASVLHTVPSLALFVIMPSWAPVSWMPRTWWWRFHLARHRR